MDKTNSFKIAVLWYIRQLEKGCLVKTCVNEYCCNNKKFKLKTKEEKLKQAVALVCYYLIF
jgi:hypothetical protein